MKLVTRRQWGARPPTCRTALSDKAITGIAVHYTASNADMVSSHADCAKRFKAIQAYHMSPGGHDPTMPWCDIAYNFGFCHHGYIFEGRGWHSRSAAQGTNDGNDHYIAIVFLGADKSGRDDVTPVGRQALSDFINFAMKTEYKKTLTVKPHNFFHSTGCPGDELEAYIKLGGWKIDKPSKWPFANVPKGFWKWNAWRLDGRLSPRPTGLPPKGSPIYVKFYAWARKYDAYVKKS
jgi:hypothetical protein